MKYTIYRVVTRSNHTYVGRTADFEKRKKQHAAHVLRGRLGRIDIPKTSELVVMSLATCNDLETAEILESRYIALDILENPSKNCNQVIGKSNKFY